MSGTGVATPPQASAAPTQTRAITTPATLEGHCFSRFVVPAVEGSKIKHPALYIKTAIAKEFPDGTLARVDAPTSHELAIVSKT